MNNANIALLNVTSPDILNQEQQLAIVLENTAIAILIFDSESHLLFANSTGHKLFEDYELKPGQRLPEVSGFESFQQLLIRARLSHTSFTEDIVWPDQRVFSAEIIPLEENYIVALCDVSRFKELVKRKNEFIAAAVHDLRSSITPIIGFNHLIKVTGPLNTSQNDFVQRIQHAATDISKLLENMLNLTKFDLDEEIKKDEVNITHLLLEITDEFRPRAELKRQLLAFEKIEVNTLVLGNAMQLRQALRNLIENAIKYTPEGGIITVSLERASNVVKIMIQDTGYGIPSSNLPYIFDRFYRVRIKGHDEIEGNGLGLAIVKSIAEGHGGYVTVDSEVGKGSCFTLTLPLLLPVNIEQIGYAVSKEV